MRDGTLQLSAPDDISMYSPESHAKRVADLLVRLNEATDRFTARLERAGERAEHAASGWSPSQIGAHVAMVNDSFAALVDGTTPVAAPPAAGFSERSWSVIASAIPARAEAPARLIPPAGVKTADAVERVRHSVNRLTAAIAALTPERGVYCITNRMVGTITLYQVGEWATAHIIRHNQQAKRLLEESGTQ